MSEVLLAEVNVSEGRDQAKIDLITQALTGTPEIKVIDQNSDGDHNRSVYTYIGSPEAVLAGTKKLAAEAIRLIDMTGHQGTGP